jgi:hypothetical protein
MEEKSVALIPIFGILSSRIKLSKKQLSRIQQQQQQTPTGSIIVKF